MMKPPPRKCATCWLNSGLTSVLKRNTLFAELPIITFHLLLKKQQARTAPLYAPAGLLLSYRRFDSRKDFL